MPEITETPEPLTARDQCLARWPSLMLICGVRRGRYRITTGTLSVASGKTARQAWEKALATLDAETNAMYRDAWNKTLEQFGHGIQSASEGPRP